MRYEVGYYYLHEHGIEKYEVHAIHDLSNITHLFNYDKNGLIKAKFICVLLNIL